MDNLIYKEALSFSKRQLKKPQYVELNIPEEKLKLFIIRNYKAGAKSKVLQYNKLKKEKAKLKSIISLIESHVSTCKVLAKVSNNESTIAHFKSKEEGLQVGINIINKYLKDLENLINTYK